jgi:hypothetical protein
MTALPFSDRQRLAKLLAVFSSDFDGEVVAAARAAHRLVHSLGLSWEDVIHPNSGPAPNSNTIQPWQTIVAACLKRPGRLRPWERDFLRSLADFVRISPKQRSVLDQIADRVLRRAAA